MSSSPPSVSSTDLSSLILTERDPDEKTEREVGVRRGVDDRAESIESMDRTESLPFRISPLPLKLPLHMVELAKEPMLLQLSFRSRPMRRKWLLKELADFLLFAALLFVDVADTGVLAPPEAPLVLPRDRWSATKNRRALFFCLVCRRPCRRSGGSSRKLRVDPPRSKTGSVRATTSRALRLLLKLAALKLFMVLSVLLGVEGRWCWLWWW